MDLAIETGTDYEKFGTLLLEDKKGNKVKNIKVSERGDPVDITVEILKQWERERASYTQTLVTCLRATTLNALADNMKRSSSNYKDLEEL